MAFVGGATAAGNRPRRVLFFPLPYQGHINPMFQLAGLLHSRGFAITIFHTNFNAPDASQHPAYDFVPVPVPDDYLPEGSSDIVQSTLEHILAMNRVCEAPFREILAALLAQQQAAHEDVSCLVADAHLLMLLDVARELGVPTLVVRTSSAAHLRMLVVLPMLRDKGYQLMAQESQLEAPVKELPPYRVRDLPFSTSALQGVISEVVSRIVTAVRTSSGLILNTIDTLESRELASLRRDLNVPVFDIGPLHKLCPAASSSSLLLQDRSCLEWLDAQAPLSVLYVSFGSVAIMSAGELVETAWGLANSGHPFLWVLRPGLVHGTPLSETPPLPDSFDAATRGRGVVVSWAPQEEVLAHPAVGAFWTHCGWNSTLESVCAGVPIMARPCFGDQTGNARYMEHVWRTGLTLDGELVRGKVEAAVTALLGPGEPGAGLRRRARQLKSSAAECMAKDGSSYTNVDNLVHHIQTL